MEVIIVPCTQEKVWDEQPAKGPTAAKDAYTKPCFLEWRRYAEGTGQPWYVLSTKHGLLAPDDVVPGPYNVPISAAVQDQTLLRRLQTQGRQVDFGRFERVVLLDWEKFAPLVQAAVGDAAPRVLRPIVTNSR
jgi:hypothetical protein